MARISTAIEHGAPWPQGANVAKAVLLKLETLEAALVRSDFFKKHALLRTTLLLVYDDASREDKLELKMMNFGFSYAIPNGGTIEHLDPWDGSAASHEDGYLTGLRSLARVIKSVVSTLEAKPNVNYV